ncbi:hypothetical protein MICRO80W_1010002 [Micrococcus luteus]|nr:hypothetical protein MICRO80W_1010002 [Micrococcus luteus]
MRVRIGPVALPRPQRGGPPPHGPRVRGHDRGEGRGGRHPRAGRLCDRLVHALGQHVRYLPGRLPVPLRRRGLVDGQPGSVHARRARGRLPREGARRRALGPGPPGRLPGCLGRARHRFVRRRRRAGPRPAGPRLHRPGRAPRGGGGLRGQRAQLARHGQGGAAPRGHAQGGAAASHPRVDRRRHLHDARLRVPRAELSRLLMSRSESGGPVRLR